MALEYSTIPAECLPAADSVEESLYVALEQNGCRPARALQRLRAVLFTEAQAELLHVRPRDAGLLIERRGSLENGQVVELTQSYYRGDAYDFVAELTYGPNVAWLRNALAGGCTVLHRGHEYRISGIEPVHPEAGLQAFGSPAATVLRLARRATAAPAPTTVPTPAFVSAMEASA